MKKVLSSGIGAVAGLALVMFFLVLTFMIFGQPVGASLKAMYVGSVADWNAWSKTLVKMTPLILTGLGAGVAWRAGMYNIGGEGQFILGGVGSAWLAKMVVFPNLALGGLTLPALLLASMAGGAVWSGIAAWLYLKRGVDVVIGTILLNFIAKYLIEWTINGPLQEAKHQLPQSDALPQAAMLMRFDRQHDANIGVFIAVIVAVGIAICLFATASGYRLRVVGASPSAARANLIPSQRVQMMAMLLSGALCGLAGGLDYVGVSGQIGIGFSQQWGFLGIPVALLGGLHPLGILASGAFFGMLFAGSEQMARSSAVGTTLIYVVQAAVVLAVVFARGIERKVLPQVEAEP